MEAASTDSTFPEVDNECNGAGPNETLLRCSAVVACARAKIQGYEEPSLCPFSSRAVRLRVKKLSNLEFQDKGLMQKQLVPVCARNLFRAGARIVITFRFISFVLIVSAIGLVLLLHNDVSTQAKTTDKSKRALRHRSPAEDLVFRAELAARLRPLLARAVKSRTLTSSAPMPTYPP